MAQQPPPQPFLSPGHSPSYPQGTLSYPAKWQHWPGVWQEGSVCCHRAPQPREPSLTSPPHWDQDSPLLEQGYLGPLTPSPFQHPSCHSELGSPPTDPLRILFASNSPGHQQSYYSSCFYYSFIQWV